MPPEGIIAFAMFSGSLDQLIQEKGHLPFDLMQACYISQYLADAREQLLNSDAAKFGYSIASIFVIIAKKQREIARQAGKGRKGYEGPFTLFIKDVIKFTQKKNPKYTAKHAISHNKVVIMKSV